MTSGEIQHESSRWRAAWVAVAVVGAVLLAAGAKVCLEYGWAWRCPAMVLFEVPCPSCGSTRAFAALAGLDLLGALRFNPMIVMGVVALPFVGFLKRVVKSWEKYGWGIFAGVVILNWVYLVLFLPR
jgi:Protein of unknown function (DUF2752)